MAKIVRQGDTATCGHVASGSSTVFIEDKGASRVGADSAGGLINGGASDKVKVNGSPLALHGGSIVSHGPPPHSAAVTIAGSVKVEAT